MYDQKLLIVDSFSQYDTLKKSLDDGYIVTKEIDFGNGKKWLILTKPNLAAINVTGVLSKIQSAIGAILSIFGKK